VLTPGAIHCEPAVTALATSCHLQTDIPIALLKSELLVAQAAYTDA
jgi:hypothetical protein